MLPPLCLLAALSLKRIRLWMWESAELRKRDDSHTPTPRASIHRVVWSDNSGKARPGRGVRVILSCLLAIGLLIPVLHAFPTGVSQFSAPYVIGDTTPDLDPTYLQLARHIRLNSGEDDRIFVWGFQPIIYVASGRRPASRFIICHALTGQIPWVNIDPDTETSQWILPGSWARLMDELEKNRPLFIVDTSPGNYAAYGKYPIHRYLQLYWFIRRHYVMDRVIFRSGAGGKRPYYHVYRRRVS